MDASLIASREAHGKQDGPGKQKPRRAKVGATCNADVRRGGLSIDGVWLLNDGGPSGVCAANPERGLPGELVMAGYVRVDKIERSMGSKVLVKFDVQTSVGALPIERTVDDFGSSGENEKQALLEVRKLLEEALDMVSNKLG